MYAMANSEGPQFGYKISINGFASSIFKNLNSTGSPKRKSEHKIKIESDTVSPSKRQLIDDFMELLDSTQALMMFPIIPTTVTTVIPIPTTMNSNTTL